MFKKSLALTAVLFSLSTPTLAGEWNISGGYSNFSNSDVEDISLSAATLSVGYEFKIESSQFSITPELRLGMGISDDKVYVLGQTVEVEVDHFTALSVRGTYYVSDAFYVFAQPAYGNLEVEASVQGFSASEDESEFGYGAGFGLLTGKGNVGVEVVFEKFDDVDVFSANARFYF